MICAFFFFVQIQNSEKNTKLLCFGKSEKKTFLITKFKVKVVYRCVNDEKTRLPYTLISLEYVTTLQYIVLFQTRNIV